MSQLFLFWASQQDKIPCFFPDLKHYSQIPWLENLKLDISEFSIFFLLTNVAGYYAFLL